jgi:hypothetical protein
MILLSSDEYYAKTQHSLSDSLITELVKLHRYQTSACYLGKNRISDDFFDFIINRHWDPDHTIGFYLTENFRVANESVAPLFRKAINEGKFICYVILAPDIKDENCLWTLINRLSRLKAFL